nr:reverse transcriptase domain-containing protein [Tanacetum cinerariifolium]
MVSHIQPPSEVQTPSLPFPRRLRKEKEEAQQRKFLENLKQLHINLPFIEALAQMPKYAKFLTGLLINKARLEESYTITMNERCSAVILNKLPSKEKDTGSFTIPCDIGQLHINNALADLGSSISLMPYTMYGKLGLRRTKGYYNELKLTDRIDDLDNTINAKTQELLANDKSDLFLLKGLEKSINQSDLDSCECFESKVDDDSDPRKPIRRIDSVNTPYSVTQETSRPDKVKSEQLYSASANEIDEKKLELKNLHHHLEYAYLHDRMLARCEETNLVLNWKKCHFIVKERIVLGHKILGACIEVDKAKIDVIAKFPYPTNVKGVRSFLGHAGFYRRFIKDFSISSKPMTQLLMKDAKFDFFDDCKKTFNILKEKLTTAPIIISPNWNTPFELMCDASDFAVGAILRQRINGKFKPIYYASKTLNNAQEHYTITEKELLAVVFSFDKFRPYLILSKTVIYTDHSTLKYLFSKHNVKPKFIRCVLLLQGFDIEIKDKKG